MPRFRIAEQVPPPGAAREPALRSTAAVEKRTLEWMARGAPRWTSHQMRLTMLGLAAQCTARRVLCTGAFRSAVAGGCMCVRGSELAGRQHGRHAGARAQPAAAAVWVLRGSHCGCVWIRRSDVRDGAVRAGAPAGGDRDADRISSALGRKLSGDAHPGPLPDVAGHIRTDRDPHSADHRKPGVAAQSACASAWAHVAPVRCGRRHRHGRYDHDGPDHNRQAYSGALPAGAADNRIPANAPRAATSAALVLGNSRADHAQLLRTASAACWSPGTRTADAAHPAQM